MHEFIQRSFPKDTVLDVHLKGHPIPIYRGQRLISSPRVCVVGDAANLVDPILGEGIRYAVKSGILAARATAAQLGLYTCRADELAAASGPQARGCDAYQGLVTEQILPVLEGIRRLSFPFFISKPGFYYKQFVIGQHNYRATQIRL